MTKQLIVIFLVGVLFISCKKNSSSFYTPTFVVEGWIENGEPPYVILTHNIPADVALDSANLYEIVIRWAKVTVSDGVNTEVLTLKKDNRFSPAYIYKGNTLIGEIGKTYTLKVEYAGFTFSSITNIPKVTLLDSIWFTDVNSKKRQLNVSFTDNPIEKNYYKIYTKSGNDKRFYPTLISNFDDKYFSGRTYALQVNKGPKTNLSITNDTYFEIGDTVYVKFSAMPPEAFAFWDSFNNELVNAINPFLGSSNNSIKHNIQGGAIGIWSGYGSNVYRAIATQ
jgi:hypothetical protein